MKLQSLLPVNVHLVDITLFYAAEGGGVTTYLSAKVAWLRQASAVRHTVLVPHDRAHALPGLPFVAVPSLSIGNVNGYRLPRSIRRTASMLTDLKPDVIEVGDPYHFAWAALHARRSANVPVAAFYHSDLARVVAQRYGKLAARAARRYTALLYRRFDLVFAPSRAMVHSLRELGVDRVQHQPLGVDTAVYAPSRRDPDLRARLGLPRTARLLVYAGRSTPEKKLPLLIEAVRRLGAPYYLLQVGGNAPAGAAERVVHLPFERRPVALAELLASCDMLVHPCDQETFGLVVLEAMACGIPVLGVDAGGVAELIDSESGLLVRPGDAAALAEGIAALYCADRARLGAQARRKVLEQYDWRRIFPQLMAHYANLLASRQQPELKADLSLVAE